MRAEGREDGRVVSKCSEPNQKNWRDLSLKVKPYLILKIFSFLHDSWVSSAKSTDTKLYLAHNLVSSAIHFRCQDYISVF